MMIKALEKIQAEHRGMWQILNVLEESAHAARESGVLQRDLVELELDYLESYIDQVHHPKEDRYLFTALLARTDDARTLIADLQQQHQQEAQRLGRLRAALSDGNLDLGAFAKLADDYIGFQRVHMRQEEDQLFRLAREHLTGSDWQAIDDAFANNKDPLFGEQAHGKYAILRSHIAAQAQPPLGLGGTSVTRIKADAQPLLELRGVSAHYGRIAALRNVSIQVGKGQLVALVGSNGAGKTTLLRTISGLQAPSGGEMIFEGRDLCRIKPAQRVADGIAHVPEGRQVFAPLSVEDNLVLGAYSRTEKGAAVRREIDHIYDIFPVLRDKRKVPAGTLSGGQQQMLAIGRAMMAKPRLMLLDEPSMGLSPLLVSEVFEVIKRLQQEGITILIVEQNAAAVLALADIGYVLESGEITHSGEGWALRDNEEVKRAYLGI